MADNYNTLVLMFGQGNAFGGTEVDYDCFMEEFRKDYGAQIELTTEQLKNIVNEKNVNGKGEKLSEAVKIILEKRLAKTIEKNRSVYGSKSHIISPELLTLLQNYQEKGELPEPAKDVIDAEPVEEAADSITEAVVDSVEEPAIEKEEKEETTAPVQAFTEFLKHGEVSELVATYGNSENTYVGQLVAAIERYAEVMEFCNVGEIYAAITGVKAAADAVTLAEDVEEGFADFASKVAESYLIEDDSVKALVKWCIKQGKIRQAAEVYAELMPEYFFDTKVIYFENYHENKKNDGSYGDTVVDARKQAKSKKSLKCFWLNEMLWKNISKKLFLNVDKAILDQDGPNARRFKMIFREIKELQETRKNKVQVGHLSKDVADMFERIANGGYISPVLNTTQKVCNYFFNYEVTGTPGSVQKSYRDLSLILLSNKGFCEEYFGEESVQIVTFTPASILMNKEQSDVKSKLSITQLEKTLRIYEKVREQVGLMGEKTDASVKRMGRNELKELLQNAVEEY